MRELRGFAFILMLFASHSYSTTYLLNDVVFNDGGTAYGQFDWSMSEGASNISITTTAGTGRDFDVLYTDVTSGLSVIGNNFGVSLETEVGGNAYNWYFSVEFDGPSDNALYLTSIESAPGLADQYGELGNGMSYRYLQSGYLSEVPVPSSFLLFASALVGLAARCRGRLRGFAP